MRYFKTYKDAYREMSANYRVICKKGTIKTLGDGSIVGDYGGGQIKSFVYRKGRNFAICTRSIVFSDSEKGAAWTEPT